MKKYSFATAILLLLSSTGFSQRNPAVLKDTILWNADYHLTRADFKAKPKGGYYGLTASAIMLSTKEENGTIKFVVEAVFLRSRSSLKTDSEYGLKHEQGHFDICEINTRRLRQRIATKDFMKSKKLFAEINALYKQANIELQKEQDQYDRETEHSINMVRQEYWNKKIAAELDELKEYSGTEVNVVNR